MACIVLGGLAVVLLLLDSAAVVVSARLAVRPEAIDRDMFQVHDIVNDRKAEHHVDNDVKKGMKNTDQSRDGALTVAAPSPAESSPSASANLHMLDWLWNLLGKSSTGSATGQSPASSPPTAVDGGN